MRLGSAATRAGLLRKCRANRHSGGAGQGTFSPVGTSFHFGLDVPDTAKRPEHVDQHAPVRPEWHPTKCGHTPPDRDDIQVQDALYQTGSMTYLTEQYS